HISLRGNERRWLDSNVTCAPDCATSQPIREAWSCQRRNADAPFSFRRVGEISQGRRCLPLVGWHPKSVAAGVVDVVPNSDMGIVLHADRLGPPDRSLIGCAAVGFCNSPWARQRVVDDGDLVVNDVRVVLRNRDPFLDYCLVVLVQWDPG